MTDRPHDVRMMVPPGVVKVMIALVAGSGGDIAAAARVARQRAADNYQGDGTRWALMAALLEECVRDTSVMVLGRAR